MALHCGEISVGYLRIRRPGIKTQNFMYRNIHVPAYDSRTMPLAGTALRSAYIPGSISRDNSFRKN